MIAPQVDTAPLLIVLGFGFLAALPMIGSALGSIFGGAAEGRANQQANQAAAEQQRNNLLADIFRTQQGAQMQQGALDLQRKAFDAGVEKERLRRALVGQLLGNAQNLTIDIPGIPRASISGGLGPNALGASGRALAQMISRRALSQLDTPTDWQGGNIVDAPAIGPVPKQGGGGLLNTLGLVGSVLGGLGGIFGGGGGGAARTTPGTITGALPSQFRIGGPNPFA